jgi:hypothetical protein
VPGARQSCGGYTIRQVPLVVIVIASCNPQYDPQCALIFYRGGAAASGTSSSVQTEVLLQRRSSA